MANIWNQKRSIQCIWSAVVMTTFGLCVALVYISLSFGNKYSLVSHRHTVPPSSETLREDECISVCTSRDCVQQSNYLLNNIQSDANPCDDFYKFACGKFLKNSSPEDASSFLSQYLYRMRIKLKSLLDNLEANSINAASKKMKIVYDSCMKQSSDFQAIPIVLQIFNQFGLQGWPNLISDFKFENSTLTRLIANLLAYQEYGFVKFFREPTIYMLDPSLPANLSLESDESLLGEKEQSLISFTVDRILNYFEFDTKTIKQIQQETIAIYNATTRLKQDSRRISDEDENATAIFIDCTSSVESKWKDLCEIVVLFSETVDVKEINKNYVNIVPDDVYFMQNIFTVLRNFSDRSIANYLALNVFMKHLDDLNIYFRLTYQKDPITRGYLDDVNVPISHWQHCVDWISSRMVHALAYEFIKKDFTLTMLQEVQNLTDELINESAEYLSGQDWISNSILKHMMEQTRNIKSIIPIYMKFFANETFINEFYNEFIPGDGSFLNNILEYQKFLVIGEMRGYGIVSKIYKFRGIFRPGASGGGGSIDINLGLLLPPAYSPRIERLINIVSVGMIIAHEIGHNIFDFDHFRMFDQATNDYFDTKRKCLEDQISKFRFDIIGKNLNGSQYSHEDIADNVAVSVTGKMIERYMSNGEEIALPAFPYSTKQMLYISAAQIWCTADSKEKEEINYKSGSHSPEKFRTLVMMQNSKDFAETFSCPEGSYMNPPVKCHMLTEKE